MDAARGFALLVIAALCTACEQSTESYFPLSPGWRWEYTLNVVTADGRRQGKYFIVNLPAHRLGDSLAVPRRTVAGATFLYREETTGVLRVAEAMPGEEVEVYAAPRTVLPYPLTVGRQWNSTTHTSVLEMTSHAAGHLYRIDAKVSLTYTVESTTDTVVVPAGRFSRCVRVKGIGVTTAQVRKQSGLAEIRIESTEWYAPGAGLIKVVRSETTSSSALPAGEYEMQLEALWRG